MTLDAIKTYIELCLQGDSTIETRYHIILKQKEIANFRKSLQVNQKVITAGGIHGIIKEINDNDVVLEIASNVKIHIDKNSIFAAAADANSSQVSK